MNRTRRDLILKKAEASTRERSQLPKVIAQAALGGGLGAGAGYLINKKLKKVKRLSPFARKAILASLPVLGMLPVALSAAKSGVLADALKRKDT